MNIVYKTDSPAETEALGVDLGSRLHAGQVLAMTGDLAAGKTTFLRGLARGMGLSDDVTSPTFAIVHEYREGKLPLFHFGEGLNKYRRAKSDVLITQFQLDDAREKVSLQVNQFEKKISECDSRLEMAHRNMESAEENMRVADIGFREGVVEPSVVMAAQTAWLKANSEEIDAAIERIMADVYLRQAVGMLK